MTVQAVSLLGDLPSHGTPGAQRAGVAGPRPAGCCRGGSGRGGRGSPAPACLGGLPGPLGPGVCMRTQRPKGLGSRPTHRWHEAGLLGRRGHAAHHAFARRGARLGSSHVGAALGPSHPAFAGDTLKERGPWLMRAPGLALRLVSQVAWGEWSLLFPCPQPRWGRRPRPSRGPWRPRKRPASGCPTSRVSTGRFADGFAPLRPLNVKITRAKCHSHVSATKKRRFKLNLL